MSLLAPNPPVANTRASTSSDEGSADTPSLGLLGWYVIRKPPSDGCSIDVTCISTPHTQGSSNKYEAMLLWKLEGESCTLSLGIAPMPLAPHHIRLPSHRTAMASLDYNCRCAAGLEWPSHRSWRPLTCYCCASTTLLSQQLAAHNCSYAAPAQSLLLLMQSLVLIPVYLS